MKNTKEMTIMPDVVGQERLKRKFNFHLKPYAKNGIFPSTLLNASMGEGKTMMLKSLARELGKKTAIINCASIKNANSFVEQVYQPYLSSGEPFTILADEFQVLDNSTQSLLLTMLTPNKDNYNDTNHTINGVVIPIRYNMKVHTFLAATTNIESLLPPLVDRFRVHAAEKYTQEDLRKILKKELDNIHIIETVLKDVLRYIRVNPRSCVMFANDIRQQCLGEGTSIFDKSLWETLKFDLGLRLYGIDALEESLLNILKDHPTGIRLTSLASSLRLDNKSVQRIERYLVYHDLMVNANGIRILTDKGKEYFDV